MFGAFHAGSVYLGKSIWGLTTILRENPDIDGQYVPSHDTDGVMGIGSIDEGNLIPSYTGVATVETVSSNDGVLIDSTIENGRFTRLK